MSAKSASLPSSPIQHRDIRSASKPFKRDKDHSQKWSNGQRPSAGVSISYVWREGGDEMDTEYLVGGSERQREKVRPLKQWSQMASEHKSHANQTPKPTARAHNYGVSSGASAGRIFRKMDATIDANDEDNSSLSRSLLDLLPVHSNNTSTPIQTTVRPCDEGIFYSFDNIGQSPQQNGRAVDLGGLVEQAEQKFRAEQTDKIVRDEYAVLDQQGETTILNKKGKKGSPKQRAIKTETAISATTLEDDDGFELV